MPQPPNETSLLFLITGSRGAGKTTFCNALVQAARGAGWKVSGVISQAVYEGNQRIAIDAEALHTGEKRRLATRSDQPAPGTRYWQFDEAVIAWCNQVFQASIPTDLLMVDELGPLEFEDGIGWQAALQAIDSRQYAIGMVVVRAELIGIGLMRWPDANLVEIETPEESAQKAHILAGQLF